LKVRFEDEAAILIRMKKTIALVPSVLLLSGLLFSTCGASCKNNSAILSADEVAIDLTDTVCEPLENQTAGQPYVDFICTLAEGAEDVIADIETAVDAGPDAAPAASSTIAQPGSTSLAKVRKVRVRIPAALAPAFIDQQKAAKAARAAKKAAGK
jgi:hypothetical protein